MEIKKIIFYFDNTESIEIPVERTGSILIDDITESISRLASNYVARQKMFTTIEHMKIMKENKDSLYTIDKAIDDVQSAFDQLEMVEEKYDYQKLPKDL